MKNIEKYPNTNDALEAYNRLSDKRVTFYTWLECEFEEPRVPTLLEAAKELKSLWDKSISSCQSVKLETWNDAIDRLSDAVEREKCKPVRNCDAFSKDEVLEMLEDRSFSKEDTIEWLYGKAEGGVVNGSK